MTRFYQFLLLLIIVVPCQSTHAGALSSDTTFLYKPVMDSLIRIALLAKQPNPVVIISKFRSSASAIVSAVDKFQKDPYGQAIINNDTYKALAIDSVRMLLALFKNVSSIVKEDLSQISSPAKITFKANGWRVFKSIKSSKRIHQKDPNFFCVASITKPVYLGNYAAVVIDRLFYHERGGGYLQLMKKERGKWQTLAITQLWHH